MGCLVCLVPLASVPAPLRSQLLHSTHSHLISNLTVLAHEGAALEASVGPLPMLGATAFVAVVGGVAEGAAVDTLGGLAWINGWYCLAYT